MQGFSINRNRLSQVCALIVAGVAGAVIWTWMAGVGELLAFGPQPKPMSPAAALLSLLVGATLYFYYRDSQRAATIWLSYGVGGILLVAGGSVCLRYWCGWDSPVEHWLMAGAGRIGNFPVGQISLACGVVLVMAALAFLARLPARRSLRWISLGLAVLVLLAGVWVVGSYIHKLPWGGGLNRISLLGGVVFSLLGVVLLGPESTQRPRAGLMPVLITVGLAVVIGTGGAIGLRQLQMQERIATHRLLKSVNNIKADEIWNWREERLEDARMLGQAPVIGHDFAAFLAQPDAVAARAGVLRWLDLVIKGHRYAVVEVFDTNGVRRLSIPDATDAPDNAARAEVAAALQSREVVVEDLHRDSNGAPPHFDLAVAVRDAEQPVGVVRLVIDQRQFVYPALRSLPLPYQTAEAMLFRVDGREVVALSGLRLRADAALNFRIPIVPESQRPIVRAVLGEFGEVEGVDYRNMPVLATTRKIPNSPWLLSTKVDCAEIYAPINRHAWLVLTLTVLLAALVGILAELFWERKRRALAERVEYLMNNANDAILVQDEYLHIQEANSRALELFGFSLAELRAMTSAIELRAPAARPDFHAQTDPLFLNEQAIYETVYQRKDGTVLPVEISSRVVKIAGRCYVFSILRDLTLAKAQARQIVQLSRYYNTLGQINQGIARVHSRKDLFREVCRLAADHGGFKAVWIGLLNRETQAVLTAAAAGESREIFERVRIYADDRPEGRGTIGTCIRTGQPAIVNNIASDPNLAPWHEHAAAYGLCAVASLPVRFRGEVAGAFAVFAGESGVFHEEEINLLMEIATDISFALDNLDLDDKRQRAENELFVSRERYRAIFENMQDGFYCLQLVYVDDKVQNAIYLEVNPAHGQITGLKNVVGQKMTDSIPDVFQTNPEILVHFERVDQTGKSERHETYVPQLQRWLAVLISSLGKGQLSVFISDITARRTSEERLLRSLEAAGAVVWENNLLTGELQQTGDVAAVFGRPPGYRHATHAAFLDDIHPADRARIADVWRTTTPLDRQRQFEFRVCQPAGGVRWLSSTGTAEFDSTGRVIALRGVTRDVTATRYLAEERETMVRALSLINSSRDLPTLLSDITKSLQDWLGCDAVGIRLCDGDDFSDHETYGSPAQSVQIDNPLCQRAAGGQPSVECLCDNVLRNQVDSTKPWFTARGSFWTNSVTELRASTTGANQPGWLRGQCVQAGHESVALVALRAGATVVGLLQIKDQRKHQLTAERIGVLERLADSLAEGIAHRQSAAQYRLLAEHAEDVVLLESADGRALYRSPSFYRITGWSAAEIAASDWRTRVHPDDLARIEAAIAANLRGETNWTEHRHLCKDGSYIWLETYRRPEFDATGRVSKIILWGRNITDRKQIQDDLQLRSNALQVAANAVVITDAAGRIEWVNAAFTRLTGYTEAEVLGQNLRLLKSGRYDAAFYRQLWETIQAGRIWHGELFNRRKDGSEYNEEMTITPVGNGHGPVTHFIAIKQDVSLRKQEEQQLADTNRQLTLALTQLRDAQKQLVAQERLRALGQMASGIAHDFNNALTPILGFADLLLQHPDLVTNRERLQHYIRLIHLSAQDAAQIVRRLHEFHRRRRSGEVFLPLQLNTLVKDTVELTAPRWRQQMQAAGITITILTMPRCVSDDRGSNTGTHNPAMPCCANNN